MSTQKSRSVAARARKIQNVDGTRPAADPFKLPAPLRATLDADLSALDRAGQLVQDARGADALASPRVRAAIDTLEDLLRQGYRTIDGLPDYQLDPLAKREVFEAYGWTRGLIGDFDDTRTLEMAEDAVALAAAPAAEQPAWLYPAPLLALIAAQLSIIEGETTTASGSAFQTAIDARDKALAKLRRTNTRVRFYYCSASDEVDRTPELVKIDFQPRRDPEPAAASTTTKPAPSPQS